MFLGVDHVDTRVRSLRDVEPFYDRFFAAIGLVRKKYSYVDEAGEWSAVPPGVAANVAEYFERTTGGAPPRFVGIIEDGAPPSRTRIAFCAESVAALDEWYARLPEMGAEKVERSTDPAYPAIFFEDPCGTRLELVARVARPSPSPGLSSRAVRPPAP